MSESKLQNHQTNDYKGEEGKFAAKLTDTDLANDSVDNHKPTLNHSKDHILSSNNSSNESEAEYKAIINCHDKLVAAISADPLGIAGTLLAKSFIPPHVEERMRLADKTDRDKATILVEAIRDKIKIAPKRIDELIRILSEQEWTKDIKKILQSVYQGI